MHIFHFLELDPIACEIVTSIISSLPTLFLDSNKIIYCPAQEKIPQPIGPKMERIIRTNLKIFYQEGEINTCHRIVNLLTRRGFILTDHLYQERLILSYSQEDKLGEGEKKISFPDERMVKVRPKKELIVTPWEVKII